MKIEKYWDNFLRAYYCQKCEGCPDGHSSFWKTIIESKEWEEWKKYNFKISPYGNWDFSACEETGIMSKEQWKALVEWLKRSEKIKNKKQKDESSTH